mmetsp:Transcript_11614/g.17872  ORF Transcript_11614/g.17872 Transcript_11614/m.17872 type:complete len:150 (+) Transcript_11614:83-532(+)
MRRPVVTSSGKRNTWLIFFSNISSSIRPPLLLCQKEHEPISNTHNYLSSSSETPISCQTATYTTTNSSGTTYLLREAQHKPLSYLQRNLSQSCHQTVAVTTLQSPTSSFGASLPLSSSLCHFYPCPSGASLNVFVDVWASKLINKIVTQ